MNNFATTLAACALCISAYSATPAAADAQPTGAQPVTEAATCNGASCISPSAISHRSVIAAGILDDPASGGNGDGFVCGIPLGNRATPSGNQLYEFFDNQFAA